MDMATQSALAVIGLLGFIGATLVVLIISVIYATRINAESAAENRKSGKPVSNGYAAVAVVTLVIIFAVVILLGLVPPLLQRG